jgi:glycosyltransferase involved in cell wall biosynthesis
MMQRVLHVISHGSDNGAARQLALLAGGLDRSRFESRTVALEFPGRRTPVDFRPLWELRRRIVDFGPDIIHAWQPAALWAAGVARSLARHRCSLVATGAATGSGKRWQAGFERWLLGRVDRVVVSSAAEARRLGLDDARVAIIRPAASAPSPLMGERGGDAPSAPPTLTLPHKGGGNKRARIILCGGPVDSTDGFLEALWAFDILRYLYNDLQLLFVGDGAAAARLEKLSQDVDISDVVHFLGSRNDTTELLRQAEMAWVVGTTGAQARALETLAAGRPIIALRRPELLDIIEDGVDGMLVSPGQPVSLARKAATILADPNLAQRLAAAGREKATRDFSLERMVGAYSCLYEEFTTRRLKMTG